MSSPTGSAQKVDEAAGAALDNQEVVPSFVDLPRAAFSGIQRAPQPSGLSRTQKIRAKAQDKTRQRALDEALMEDVAASERQRQAPAEQARLLSSNNKLFVAAAVTGLVLLCIHLWPIKSQGPPDGGGAGSGAGHVGFGGVSCICVA